MRQDIFCESLDEEVPHDESCEDELNAIIIDTRTRRETCEQDESEISEFGIGLPTAIHTTPVRSARARQFFPSSSQTKKSDSVSSLREKLVQSEIDCMLKLNAAKIKIAQAEHKARMDLLSKQSLAAEAQIEFWNAASLAEKQHHRNITDFAKKAAYVKSIQQADVSLESTEFED